MAYSTLMVHVELDHPNDMRLRIAGQLADQFDAKLIGIAAADPQPSYYADGSFARGLVEHERAALRKLLAEAEARFRQSAGEGAREIEWRCAMAPPTDFLAREARAADLIVIGANRGGALLDPLRRLDPNDFVMRAGRPVFVVPPEVEHLSLKSIVVGWKDSREARRAVVDALPLLHKAKEVTVVEVVDSSFERDGAQRRVDDVSAWLRRHGIVGPGRVIEAADRSEQLDALWRSGADLVVAGAYGHSRFREWILGGVTRNLLMRSQRCSFLTH